MATRRDRHVLAIAALTACCWLALATWPAGQLFVCGAGGITGIIPAWSVGRALSLFAMWTVMSAGMMLPCAAVGMVRRGVDVEVVLVKATVLGVVVAPAQWVLESLGAMHDGLLMGGAVTQALLVLIAGIAVGMHLARGARWAGPVAMIALQFAGAPMNFGWMAIVAAGMLLLAIARPSLVRRNDPLLESGMFARTE